MIAIINAFNPKAQKFLSGKNPKDYWLFDKKIDLNLDYLKFKSRVTNLDTNNNNVLRYTDFSKFSEVIIFLDRKIEINNANVIYYEDKFIKI